MQLKTKTIIASAMCLAYIFLQVSSVYAGACEPILTAPAVTQQLFTTNYTVGGLTYAKGGQTIRINATIGNMCNNTAGYYNVSAKVFDNTTLKSTVYLANVSVIDATADTAIVWTGTYSVPATDVTNPGNITINATYVNQSAGIHSGATVKELYRVDATAPTVTAPTCGVNDYTPTGACNLNFRGDIGDIITVCWNVSDTVAVDTSNATLFVTVVPSGSVVGSAVATAMAGGSATNQQVCLNETTDEYGAYTFHVAGRDNVTNEVSGSSVTGYFAQKVNPALQQPDDTGTNVVTTTGNPIGITMPTFSMPKIDLIQAILNGWNYFISFRWL